MSTAQTRLLDPGFELTLRPMRYPQFYEMYRAAIALRREHGLGRSDAPVEFLEDLPEGLLGLVRGEVVVLVNTSEQELPLPAGPDGLDLADAEMLVGSAEPVPGRLPADAAVWLRRR